MSLTYSAAALSLAIVTYAATSRRRRHEKPLPPGPSPLPLIGNVHQMDGSEPWLTFTEWKDGYGDVVYCSQFGVESVILNTEEAARDLMEKRSSNYSDRVHSSLREPYGLDWDTVFLQHNETWRLHRRVAHQSLREHHVDVFQPTQLRFSEALLSNLEKHPKDWHQHLVRYAGSIMVSALYDHDVAPANDPVTQAVTAATALSNKLATPANMTLITFLPFLKYTPTWLPGGWRNAAEARRTQGRKLNQPFEYLKEKIAAGTVGNTIALDALEMFKGSDKFGDYEQLVKNACATMYGAGEDTTASTLLVFFLAMCRNQHVQKRAQEELDTVVGMDRLPDFSDRDSLPYIEAVFREVRRWHPVTPLGIPHAATNDDVYRDWFIPKGTTVIANIWAMSQDPTRYPSPTTFDPTRFLDPATGQLTNDTLMFIWGFGRRICPGRHFAVNSAWIAIARLLARFTFEFEPEFIERGAEVKWANATTSITPRKPAKVERASV
ncbi:cytochrome P450 [Coniophora puteana RWD-64-598 SS2]|uniref:Cytochrome P450 n=1 Tax=Coniophora puteana (strain RWD-64-598) TaxID=741705 RepID=A0A5M3MMQ4_CONPW|nr:cytochrome P450 [Coniophora puteana RWD-64-598 SS2]EIW80307.1 cytochrome P450 [Coniophora puteana RWD-64-598 SS2]